MKPEPSRYLNKPRFLLPIIAFALLSTTFPSRILANSLLIRKGGSSLASSAHFDLIFGNELLFGSPFAGGSSSGGGGGGVLRQKSIFNHKLPTQNLPSESIMIDHRPATIAVGEQNSNNTFLSEQMDFIDVLLMFFFISGVVINLLAFFVAFIIFWNNPIVKSYILNMIAADLMLLVTGFYLKFKRIFKLLSVSSCKIVFTTDAAILHVSCWTITIIAFYRYCKLFPIRFFSTPMSDCFSKRWFVNLSLLFLWVVPFIIASPMAYYSNFDTDLVKCDSEMPYDFQTFYNVLTFLTSYVVPGLLVTFLYSRIISKTRSAISMSANRTTSSSEDSSSHVNMMRFLTYVVMAFWLLHFPFWCCNLSSTFQLYEFPRSFLHLSIIMTYFNAALNPFLYALLSVDCARCSCACLTESFLCEPVRCLMFLFCSCDSNSNSSTSSHTHPHHNHHPDVAEPDQGGDHGGYPMTSLRTKTTKTKDGKTAEKSKERNNLNYNNCCGAPTPIAYQDLNRKAAKK